MVALAVALGPTHTVRERHEMIWGPAAAADTMTFSHSMRTRPNDLKESESAEQFSLNVSFTTKIQQSRTI